MTWANVSELLRLSSKFDVPSLRSACLAFLLPSCAGNPVKGMKIAEDNYIPELYKEASRFALDNYGNWPAEELAILSEPTLLKLERRYALTSLSHLALSCPLILLITAAPGSSNASSSSVSSKSAGTTPACPTVPIPPCAPNWWTRNGRALGARLFDLAPLSRALRIGA